MAQPRRRQRLVDLLTASGTAQQDEDTLALRFDQRINNNNSFYVRYLLSDGNVDTPDRTVTPRRVRAKQRPQNVVGTYPEPLRLRR